MKNTLGSSASLAVLVIFHNFPFVAFASSWERVSTLHLTAVHILLATPCCTSSQFGIIKKKKKKHYLISGAYFFATLFLNVTHDVSSSNSELIKHRITLVATLCSVSWTHFPAQSQQDGCYATSRATANASTDDQRRLSATYFVSFLVCHVVNVALPC